MARLTCPYCYHRPLPTELLFVCDGQGAPGYDGCKPMLDPQREQRTGYNRAAMPVFVPVRIDGERRGMCPACLSWSARRACPTCHTPLPTTMLDKPSPLIGMVGGTASGKTVYLTVLNRQLREVISDQFDADVHLVGEWQAGPNSIHEWLRRHERSLFTEHQLPRPTPPSPNGRRVPLVLQWRHPKKKLFGRTVHPPTILSFCDVAGEDPAQADRQRYLSAADALIVMLDAYQLQGVRSQVPLPKAAEEEKSLVDTVLAVVTEAIRGGGGHGEKIRTPVAVVVAKLDVIEPLLDETHFLRRARPHPGRGYDDRFGTDMHEHVRALLHSRGESRVDRHLSANYERYRYFAVSSLGAIPDLDGEVVNERGVQPRNVAEPLLWLMHLSGIIDRIRRA